MQKIPHFQIVIAASCVAIAVYLGFSVWVFGWTHDAAMQGDVIGTWKSFAVAAFSFWIGSSSGGKVKDVAPVDARIVNPPDDAVNVTEAKP